MYTILNNLLLINWSFVVRQVYDSLLRVLFIGQLIGIYIVPARKHTGESAIFLKNVI